MRGNMDAGKEEQGRGDMGDVLGQGWPRGQMMSRKYSWENP
jgi:hypothetical protein